MLPCIMWRTALRRLSRIQLQQIAFKQRFPHHVQLVRTIVSQHCGQCRSHSSHTDTHKISQASSKLSVTVGEDKKTLTLTGLKSYPLRLNGTWLRYNCQCSECIQEHSGQRTVSPPDMRAHYHLLEARVHDDVLLVEWADDSGHQGVVPVQYLQENEYSAQYLHTKDAARTPTACSNNSVPTCSYDEVVKSQTGYFRWLELMNEFGVCLMTGAPTVDGTVKQVAEKIYPIQRTIYGEVFDVVSLDKPINVAYSSAHLGFHTDLLYYESPPGLQFLHCLKFDDCVEGGESELVDAWHVAEDMRLTHPEEFHVLCRVPATFQKIHFDRDHPVYMRYQKHHISVSPDGKIIAVNWAPPFEGPLCVPEEDIEPYYKAYHRFAQLLEESDSKLELLLRPGDLLGFNNRRVLHARREFRLNRGTRHLQGCYINIDEFKSEVEVQSRLVGRQLPAKRVFNSDLS